MQLQILWIPLNNQGGLLFILILIILNIATNNKKHTKKTYTNFPLNFHKTWTLTFFNQT
jgi:hypothetical protein